jgi:prepilin-type N-terminal cleavage/methylation domain-containing protein
MVNRGHHIRCAKPKRAFTLVELLVVIVVILLLASMVTPFMGAAIEQARQVDCRGRLRNLHTAAASYASENRTLVPLVHKGDFSSAGEILKSGGEFVGKYMDQSWEVFDKSYANMLSDDNVFQCPSALDNWDYHPKKTSTNYRLTGFALDLGGSWNSSRPSDLPALYPSMMAIGGTVQDSRGKHPAGRVCMAMDWISPRSAGGLPADFQADSGRSLRNHRGGANVLYGSGEAKWVGDGSMVLGERGRYFPRGTYGFREGGFQRTLIFAPDGKVVKSGSGPAYKFPNHNLGDSWGDRTSGRGIMW